MCGRGVVGEMEMCVGRGLWGRWRGERGMKEMEKKRQRKGSLVKGWGGKKKKIGRGEILKRKWKKN